MENEAGFLVDTHVFIWWMEKSKRLSADLYEIINDPTNKIFLSVTSIWEIIIKKRKKGFRVPKDLLGAIKRSKFQLLPIGIAHVLEVEKLPYIHKDPFDRILICQAIIEDLTLITSDKKIQKYNLSIIKV